MSGGGPLVSNSWVQAVVKLQSRGVQDGALADPAIRAGMQMRCLRTSAEVALAWNVGVWVPAARVRLNASACADQPGGVRGILPGRQVREGAALQVGDDLFDDGVLAVGVAACSLSGSCRWRRRDKARR